MADIRIAGVILAGGRSSRLGGGDKALRSLAGRPLLTHVVARLRPQVEEIALNANGDPARFAAFHLTVVADPLPEVGPLGGILAGLRWGRENAFTHIVTVACDTPFFPSDLVDRLRVALDHPRRIVQCSSGGRRHPTFALWPVTLAGDLESFLRETGPASMRDYASRRHESAFVDFPFDGDRDPFFNINTPEDLARAEQMAKAVR